MEIYTGWRGVVTRIGTTATKTAKDATKKGAINKEIVILQKLNTASINFVPQLITAGDGTFSYTRIQGEHFIDVYKHSSHEEKRILANKLLARAYQLDNIGVIHGELIRPHTNVLVTPENEIAIIDFERGMLGDMSGKNMRSLSQRLAGEQWIDIPTCKYIGTLNREDIYTTLQEKLAKKSLSAEHIDSSGYIVGGAVVLLFLADQISKWALYDQARGEEHLLLHPVFNTGIGRSIPVPVSAVLLLSTGIVAGIRWARSRKELSTTVTLLFLAGALGNMRDRFFLGGVRDFIDLQYRPIFNLADVFLTCGVLLLLWETWKK